jgi:hypothetical protein
MQKVMLLPDWCLGMASMYLLALEKRWSIAAVRMCSP